MVAQLIKAAFLGAKDAKRETQTSRQDETSDWRYRELYTIWNLLSPEYLYPLARDAKNRNNIHDLRAIVHYLHRHTATENTFGEILNYCTRAIRRIRTAS